MDRCSIIIPAHNEENTIGKLLSKLEHIDTKKIEVIVVCNGCTDRTAKTVKKFSSAIKMIETDVSSKTHALELGDKTAKFWPRIYVDADVIIDRSSLEELVATLNLKNVSAVSPRVKNNIAQATWPVKAFYKVWTSFPYYKDGMIGCGIYGLSKKGRKRFGEWPNLIADDGYIRAMFVGDERVICVNATVIVNAPNTLNDLIKAKSRSRLGRYQLAQEYPQLFKNERQEKKYDRALLALSRKPFLWAYIPIYLYVNIVARIRAKKQLKNLSAYKWERDLSTR